MPNYEAFILVLGIKRFMPNVIRESLRHGLTLRNQMAKRDLQTEFSEQGQLRC